MSEAKEESLYEALNKGDLSAFLSMVEAGARITPREENISRLFYCLEDVRDPKILPVIDRLSLEAAPRCGAQRKPHACRVPLTTGGGHQLS